MNTKFTPEFFKTMRAAMLEFFSRFMLNGFKLIVGFGLGVAVTTTRDVLDPAQITMTPSVLLSLVVLAFFLSLIELWGKDFNLEKEIAPDE